MRTLAKLQNNHSVNREKVCPECARDFWCNSDYLNHMNEEHGHDGTWCAVCDDAHDERYCAVALVRESRDSRVEKMASGNYE